MVLRLRTLSNKNGVIAAVAAEAHGDKLTFINEVSRDELVCKEIDALKVFGS